MVAEREKLIDQHSQLERRLATLSGEAICSVLAVMCKMVHGAVDIRT